MELWHGLACKGAVRGFDCEALSINRLFLRSREAEPEKGEPSHLKIPNGFSALPEKVNKLCWYWIQSVFITCLGTKK